jgi:putative membrane protein
MMTALVLSSLFLISYVFYHYISAPTKYGGDGILKSIYYFILLTHILLAAVILPFILFTFYQALNGQFDKHKKVARWTFPVWLYVAITGVLVYFLISPYYA